MHNLSLTLHLYSSVTVITAVRAINDFWNVRGILQWYVFQCLTPLIDTWGPPYIKYHITQLTLAKQAITVSNPEFVLLATTIPHMNLGAHQSRNTIINKNIESPICVKVFWNIILGHAKFVWSEGEFAQVIFIRKRKIGYNISCNNLLPCRPSPV